MRLGLKSTPVFHNIFSQLYRTIVDVLSLSWRQRYLRAFCGVGGLFFRCQSDWIVMGQVHVHVCWLSFNWVSFNRGCALTTSLRDKAWVPKVAVLAYCLSQYFDNLLVNVSCVFDSHNSSRFSALTSPLRHIPWRRRMSNFWMKNATSPPTTTTSSTTANFWVGNFE